MRAAGKAVGGQMCVQVSGVLVGVGGAHGVGAPDVLDELCRQLLHGRRDLGHGDVEGSCGARLAGVGEVICLHHQRAQIRRLDHQQCVDCTNLGGVIPEIAACVSHAQVDTYVLAARCNQIRENFSGQMKVAGAQGFCATS